MIFSMTTIATLFIAGIIGLLYLVSQLQKEHDFLVKEIEERLQQRTLGHNQVKARLAIMQSRFARMERENIALRQRVAELEDSNTVFDSALEDQEILEASDEKTAELELPKSLGEIQLDGLNNKDIA